LSLATQPVDCNQNLREWTKTSGSTQNLSEDLFKMYHFMKTQQTLAAFTKVVLNTVVQSDDKSDE